jgi:hypothetical protein
MYFCVKFMILRDDLVVGYTATIKIWNGWTVKLSENEFHSFLDVQKKVYRSVCRREETRRIVAPVRLSSFHITRCLIKKLHVTLPWRLHMGGSEAGEKRYLKSTCSYGFVVKHWSMFQLDNNYMLLLCSFQVTAPNYEKCYILPKNMVCWGSKGRQGLQRACGQILC